MIPVTDANIRRMGQVAAHLDACLRARGLPKLSDTDTDALWLENPDDTARMLRRLEDEHGVSGDDTAAVRGILATMVPRREAALCC